jgi:predicted nucleic acid-binding protein
MAAERIFIDTNVLLAATDRTRTTHGASTAFLQQSIREGVRLFVSGQILREYLVVATRPVDRNGLGLPPSKACVNVDLFRECSDFLGENDTTARLLMTLVKDHDLKGKRIHDAGVAATMRAHGLSHLKTWNHDDFKIFDDLILL